MQLQLFFGIVATHSLSLKWIGELTLDVETNSFSGGARRLLALISIRRVESNLLSAYILAHTMYCVFYNFPRFILVWVMLIHFLKGFKSFGVLIIIIAKAKRH